MAEARNDILLDGVHTDIPTIQYNIHTIFLNLRFHWKQSLVPIFFEMIRTNKKVFIFWQGVCKTNVLYLSLSK